jgi:hypothetical protein
MSNTYCLEYSSVQKSYHISTEEEMNRNNQVAKERNINNGYYLVSKHGSYVEALEAMFLEIAEGKQAVNQKEQTV